MVSYDYRPVAIGRLKLQEVPGQEDVDGAATRLKYTLQDGRLHLYVAFGAAGLVKVDFTESAAPVLVDRVDRVDTAAECVDVAISTGRIYLGDGSGGWSFSNKCRFTGTLDGAFPFQATKRSMIRDVYARVSRIVVAQHKFIIGHA